MATVDRNKVIVQQGLTIPRRNDDLKKPLTDHQRLLLAFQQYLGLAWDGDGGIYCYINNIYHRDTGELLHQTLRWSIGLFQSCDSQDAPELVLALRIINNLLLSKNLPESRVQISDPTNNPKRQSHRQTIQNPQLRAAQGLRFKKQSELLAIVPYLAVSLIKMSVHTPYLVIL